MLFLVSGPAFALGTDGSPHPVTKYMLAVLHLMEQSDTGMECCDGPVTPPPCKGNCAVTSLCVTKASLARASVQSETGIVLLIEFGGAPPRAQRPWSEPPPSEPPKI